MGQNKQKVFAAWNTNKDAWKNSSSGALAPLLFDYIFNNGGVVYAACFDDNLKLVHRRFTASNPAYLGTKYVQSNLGDCFRSICKDLRSGIVCFIGTPCQVDALLRIVDKNVMQNLYTVDFVCSGVPSQKALDCYVESIEEKKKQRITDIHFKDKKSGWKNYSISVEMDKGKKVSKLASKDWYMLAMLNYGVSKRPSCYHCPYANCNRVSDITLGDFWGYKAVRWQNRDDDKGVSLCIVNTEKGMSWFSGLQNIKYEERTISEAKSGNVRLCKCSIQPNNREEFWHYLNKKDYNNIEKMLTPVKLPLKRRIRASKIYNTAKTAKLAVKCFLKLKNG
ncbi:MAG: Coenzyme F420 hydrogenase/dehydrogenase, beta subunit C-terminal domain [Ruminococcus sp.]